MCVDWYLFRVYYWCRFAQERLLAIFCAFLQAVSDVDVFFDTVHIGVKNEIQSYE